MCFKLIVWTIQQVGIVSGVRGNGYIQGCFSSKGLAIRAAEHFWGQGEVITITKREVRLMIDGDLKCEITGHEVMRNLPTDQPVLDCIGGTPKLMAN